MKPLENRTTIFFSSDHPYWAHTIVFITYPSRLAGLSPLFQEIARGDDLVPRIGRTYRLSARDFFSDRLGIFFLHYFYSISILSFFTHISTLLRFNLCNFLKKIKNLLVLPLIYVTLLFYFIS